MADLDDFFAKKDRKKSKTTKKFTTTDDLAKKLEETSKKTEKLKKEKMTASSVPTNNLAQDIVADETAAPAFNVSITLYLVIFSGSRKPMVFFKYLIPAVSLLLLRFPTTKHLHPNAETCGNCASV